jgi:DNA-binding transcriptional LysR family regulator
LGKLPAAFAKTPDLPLALARNLRPKGWSYVVIVGRIGMPSWDLVKAFLALHRAGTFEGAAQALKVDQTTIRRRIQSLEGDVGVTLFTRSNGQLVLAPEHQRLLQHALQMEASCGQFMAQSNLSRLAGTIRVSTLDIFADLLAPIPKSSWRSRPSRISSIWTGTGSISPSGSPARSKAMTG